MCGPTQRRNDYSSKLHVIERNTFDENKKPSSSSSVSTRESMTVQRAQGFALILVVFTYVRRLGNGTSLDAASESAITTTANNDLYFPGSSWVLPYFVVALFVLGQQSRRLGQAWQTLLDLLQLLPSSSVAQASMEKVYSSSDTLKGGISRVPSRDGLSARIGLSRVKSSDAIRRLGSSIRKSLTSYKRRRTLQAITAKECFARLDYIEQLSVSDIALIFRYANLINRADFSKKSFLKEQNKLIRAMITAIDMAVVISRGAGAALPKKEEESIPQRGEMDALYFVAAVRIFVEWRALRLVPPGFKRYSLSMNMARGDMMQNLTKIEAAVHAYLEYHTTTASHSTFDASSPLSSPTLRELLEYEARHVHKTLPRLDNKTAAVGFLWIKRQIHYQESTFANTIQVPCSQFQTPQEAALTAYNEVYADYHGWAVQQIFKNSFGGSPPMEVLWKHMDPPVRLLKDEQEETAATTSSSQPVVPKRVPFTLPDRPRLSRPDSLDYSESTSSLLEEENEIELALGELRNDIVGAWEGTVQFFNRFLCVTQPEEEGHSPYDLIVSHESYLHLENLEETALVHHLDMDSSLHHQEKKDQSSSSDLPFVIDSIERVKNDIRFHVIEMIPLVEDWNGLIDELNMNDPSKV